MCSIRHRQQGALCTRISGSETSLEISGLGGTHPVPLVTVRLRPPLLWCSKPTTPPSLRTQQGATSDLFRQSPYSR